MNVKKKLGSSFILTVQRSCKLVGMSFTPQDSLKGSFSAVFLHEKFPLKCKKRERIFEQGAHVDFYRADVGHNEN